MENWILTVGCPPERFAECQREWLKYNILLRTAKTMPEAINEINQNDYLLLSICTDSKEYLSYLALLHNTKSIPILVAPPKYDATEKILAIELGADNYTEMPKTIEECVATAWALVRRETKLSDVKQEHISVVSNKDIFICLDYRKVFVRSVEVALTRIEFDILHLLMSNPMRVYTYEQIFRHVWGDEYYDSTNSILWNHIKRLRQKLRTESDIPDYIKNIHTVGYSFAADTDGQNSS